MMNTQDEMRHINEGPRAGEKVYGIVTVRFQAVTKSSAREALARAKEVLIACLNLPPSAFKDVHALHRALPSFFTEQFAAEPTREESDAFMKVWRAASEERRREIDASQRWTLLGWAHWMKPDNREWWWWDAVVVSNQLCAVAVVVDGWPFPWEALKVLLINSGFTDVQSEKEE
jgi:hypothetical protein